MRAGIALLIVLSVATALSVRRLSDDTIEYPDADRLLMDGVFLHDMMKDMPTDDPYGYALEYYGQYPALSIGYRPPFYPFVQALFHFVFGVNVTSSRLALLAFWLTGLTAWFLLVRRQIGVGVALASSLLLVTTPYVAQWGWYTMLELPSLSMLMWAGACFWRYFEDNKARNLVFAATLAALAAWTKQTAIVGALWFLLYIPTRINVFKFFKRRETILSILLAVVILVPLVVMTLKFGDANLAQSVGVGEKLGNIPRWSRESFTFYPRALFESHMTLPLLILSGVGLAAALLKRDGRGVFWLLLILACYVQFTLLIMKEARYAIFWIPAFAVFAALPLDYLKRARRAWGAYAAVLAGVVVFQAVQVHELEPTYAKGYDEAAAWVLENSESPTFFLDAYNNGYFIYHLRVRDEARRMYALRADKLLSSSAVFSETWLEEHVKNPEEIGKLLQEFGVALVVVEKEERTGVPVHQMLRDYLASGPFDLVKEFPVESNREKMIGQTLQVFRYRDARRPTADFIEMRLPIVGRTVKIPFPHADDK